MLIRGEGHQEQSQADYPASTAQESTASSIQSSAAAHTSDSTPKSEQSVMISSGTEFWLMRKCYYLKKFKQQGRFSKIWEAKFYWAIYRVAIQRELESEDSGFLH